VGGLALAEALVLNQSLRRLWLPNCELGEASRRALADACDAHDPTVKYGKRALAYSDASRQLYAQRFGERMSPVELLLDDATTLETRTLL
jgi:hypothetical protein